MNSLAACCSENQAHKDEPVFTRKRVRLISTFLAKPQHWLSLFDQHLRKCAYMSCSLIQQNDWVEHLGLANLNYQKKYGYIIEKNEFLNTSTIFKVAPQNCFVASLVIQLWESASKEKNNFFQNSLSFLKLVMLSMGV